MITYEKFDNYYVFSHEPNTRVYLGNHSPDDYVEDEMNQQKRSASSWYKEVHTGKKVTWDEIMDYDHDNSKPGNGQVWYESMNPHHEFDKKENYTWEGGCDFEFERKITGLATYGNFSANRSATYVPEFKSEAWAYVSGHSMERQKEIEAEIRASMDEFNREHPWLVNLHDHDGYHDDEGNSITVDQHIINMKAKYGDDVFELAEAKVDPEIKKQVEKIMEVREKTKDMSREEYLEYIKGAF